MPLGIVQRIHGVTLGVGAMLLAACSPSKTDVKAFCAASAEAPWSPGQSPAVLAAHLSGRVHDPELRSILERLTFPPSASSLAELDAAVARAGLASCPTLDLIRGLRRGVGPEGRVPR